jgi:hypothetical protein
MERKLLLQILTVDQLKDLKLEIKEELIRRKPKIFYDIYINLNKTTLCLLAQKEDMTIKDMKEMIEETFFEFGNRTIPGPSSRSIYKDKEGELLDENAMISYYADTDANVDVCVSPPLKRNKNKKT